MSELHVLHTADLHLGKNRRYSDYLTQQKWMLEGIIDQVKNKLLEVPSNDKVWLAVAGDIFDRNKDTKIEEFSLFLMEFVKPLIRLLSEYANLEIYMIDGNHDRQTNAECPSLLYPFLNFLPERFYLASVDVKFIEHSKVLLAPFNGLSENTLISLVKQYEPKFLVAHECLARMVTDTGYEPPRDQDKYVEINNVMDEAPELSAIFLGDIHKNQCLDNNKICWYSGSPITLDFGHYLPKGILHHKFENDVLISSNLIPLKNKFIKYHKVLGILDDVDSLPLEDIAEYKNRYLQCLVTPEVYQKINSMYPSFFFSPEVSWEYKKEKLNIKQAVKDKTEENSTEESTETEESLTNTYYETMLLKWIIENLNHLLKDEQTECFDRLIKIFKKRG